jgi:hypothetical protein
MMQRMSQFMNWIGIFAMALSVCRGDLAHAAIDLDALAHTATIGAVAPSEKVEAAIKLTTE